MILKWFWRSNLLRRPNYRPLLATGEYQSMTNCLHAGLGFNLRGMRYPTVAPESKEAEQTIRVP